MKKWWKRYRVFVIFLLIQTVFLFAWPELGLSSLKITYQNLLEMLAVIPPIFILLGLLDVWVEKEVMIKYLGKGAGVKGIIISLLLGSAAAGPLYAAFPVAGIFLKKGASIFNVFLFIGAWSTTKIPMLLFEASSLGWKFTLTRLLCSIVGIFLIALTLQLTTGQELRQELISRNEER